MKVRLKYANKERETVVQRRNKVQSSRYYCFGIGSNFSNMLDNSDNSITTLKGEISMKTCDNKIRNTICMLIEYSILSIDLPLIFMAVLCFITYLL